MKKIFVAHRASLGDTLLATPTLRAIKETYPDCKVVHLCSPSAKDILEGHPYIDKLLTYKKGDNIFPIIKAIWRADLALILDYHYRSSLFAWLAGIPVRIGRGNKEKSFLTQQVTNDVSEEIYQAAQTMRVAQAAGIETKNFQLEMAPCGDQEKNKVHSLLEQNGIDAMRDKIMVIAPYSLEDIKDWPQAYYQQLMDYYVRRDVKILVVGGPEYYQRAEKFVGAINLVGKTTIRETTYLLSRAALVVCGCTSVLHFAATTRTPSVAIYGPTSPNAWAPRENCHVISHNLSCSPCYHTGRICTDNKRCISEIQPAEVWEVINKLL
jgi:lipopolysaccharide heptosyltransferase II